jgi:outer membrane receptor protein involved in Fe transport
MMNQQVSRRGSITVDLYHSSDYYNSLSAGGRARAYRYSGVTKTDVVFDWEIRSGEKQTWKWYAKVDNVLNQRYYENGFRAPRATLITGLRAQFR